MKNSNNTQTRTIDGKKIEYTIEHIDDIDITEIDFSKSGSKSGQLIGESNVIVTIEGVQYTGKIKSVFTNKICKYTKTRYSKETFVFNGCEYPRNEKQLLIGLLK